jgi:succinoglycan biosynthesis protein ExoL
MPLDRDTISAPGVDVATQPPAPKILVAYFGPDFADSAVHRRVSQWRNAGFDVLPLAFTRSPDRGSSGEFINLGRMTPLSRARRLGPMTLAAIRIVARRHMLVKAGLFAARNLDLALLALFSRWVVRSSAPVVYEVLDVNVSCTEAGWRGSFLRRLEKWVLDRIDILVVSSPHFATAYYQGFLGHWRDWFLFENKIPKWIGLERPGLAQRAAISDSRRRPWRIGWFGYLDDEKSWKVLRTVAERLPDDVAICVRGTPYTHFDMRRFLADVAALDNVTYGGPYRNPEDLVEVYGSVDLVWSTDFNFPDTNSKWLLTNGIYEAGFFGKPVLGLIGTAVGEYLSMHGSGWCLSEPMEDELCRFIRDLTVEEYEKKRQKISALSAQLFVETDEIARLWRMVEGRVATRSGASREMPVALPAFAVDAGRDAPKKIVIVGLFPPPVDGQRIVTQRMLECFDSVATVLRYDVNRFRWIGPFSKLLSAVLASALIAKAHFKGFSTLYLAPHSGAGLVYSCLIALTARYSGYKLTLHYHSYRNMVRRSRLMAAFVRICGPDALHIVLAPPMADDLKHFYPAVRHTKVLSNTTFVETRFLTRRSPHGRRLRIGHLSNLSRKKGIVTVFECMRALARSGVKTELWLAGPAEDDEISALVATAQREFGDRINYLGRIAAEDVEAFYREIDVFLFPTLHEHEAEPLVIADALANGVPVFATDRGCIKYLLGDAGGRVLSPESFVEQVVGQVSRWAINPDELAKASTMARDRFVEVQAQSLGQLEGVLSTVLVR